MHKLYFDTGMSYSAPAFQCARELVGIDHLLFGTDYFMDGCDWMEWSSDFVESLGLSRAEKEKVFAKNVQEVLRL